MKEGMIGGLPFFHGSAGNDYLDELDELREIQEQRMLFDQLEGDTELDSLELMEPTGTKAQRVRNQMQDMETTAYTSGWLDPCNDHFPYKGEKCEIQNRDGMTTSEWKNLLDAARDARLAEKIDNAIPKSHESKDTSDHKITFNYDQVKIVDQDYLKFDFAYGSIKDQDQMEKMIEMFTLRPVQERAFRIVANHSIHPGASQLKMHLGGMAGTGKSQVIKALTTFFNDRGESHRFQLAAPTGSAAALIGGSTYHSLLGLRETDENRNTSTSIAKIKARIEHMEYLFIDELSMLGCRSLYNISKCLALVMGKEEEPFGGVNLILAGDFAQLPPASKEPALYSGEVGTKRQIGDTNWQQENALGKALWHQFIMVVILRENMCQQTQSKKDGQLRKCLENMRYARCSAADIKLLQSRIAGRGIKKVKLAQNRFQNISVIVGINAHRDRLNVLGSSKFAKETNQTLTNFYSLDRWPNENVEQKRQGRTPYKVEDPLRKSNLIENSLQNILWSLPHAATMNKPGILALCPGMPVMVKHNVATECCVTNGAEATVVGWKCSYMTPEKPILDVLFVKLSNPSTTIKLQGLPENVVPIVRTSEKIKCQMPNDREMTIMREQVKVVPSCSVTDYGAQGHTRPNNT